MNDGPTPFEVVYTRAGNRKERNVLGVLCPRALALHMRIAKPICVPLGDIAVDWDGPTSAHYAATYYAALAGQRREGEG